MHKLTHQVTSLRSEYTINELRQKFEKVRKIHSTSSFINRIQNWPEGYQGDYLTIEQICKPPEVMSTFDIGNYLERYALNCSISQQHRNKINIQAMNILETLANSDSPILICASGSAYDLRLVQETMNLSCQKKIILNDIDSNALKFSKTRLTNKFLENVEFDNGNVISTLKNIHKKHDVFSLILFGGLFDYLSDKQIAFSLKASYDQLQKGGKILFTNIALNNPFKDWIEICGNWELIERSEQDNLNLCEMAGVPLEKVSQYRDYTGLTNIVEIVK